MEKEWAVIICIVLWLLTAGSINSRNNERDEKLPYLEGLSVIAASLFVTMVYLMMRL